MGNSLHNKIYLGRRVPGLPARRAGALVCLGLLAGAGLTWLALRALK